MSLLILYSLALAIILVVCVAATVYHMRHPRRQGYTSAIASGTPTTPDEAGLAGREEMFSLSDGSQTPGFVVEGEKANGPCVIVLHGFGSSRYRALVWMRVFLPFVSAWVVYDQRGQGESQAATCHGGTTEVDDIFAVLAQLPDELLANGVVLYGRSMGAGTVITAAARWSQSKVAQVALQGVIAEGPYARWDQPLRRIFYRNRYPTWPVVALSGWMMRVLQPGLMQFDRQRDAAALNVPLLVLHGDADDTCPLEIGRAIAEAAPQGNIVVFEDGLHYGLVEHDEKKYEQALQQFFT